MADHLVPVDWSDFSSITALYWDDHAALDAPVNRLLVNRLISMLGPPQSCVDICVEKPQNTEICELYYRLGHISQECVFPFRDRFGIITRYEFLFLEEWPVFQTRHALQLSGF